MRRYLISFLLGCVVEVKPDQETIEIESSKGARFNWHGLQQQTFAPACTTAPRRYYTKTYCPTFYTPKCRVVRCPIFSCLETAFFEAEAETRSSLEMGVKFRKGSRGVTISSNGRGIRTKACSAAYSLALGCDNFAEVKFGPNMRIFDEDTNTQYLLAEVSAACGGPFYQPVLIGGCWIQGYPLRFVVGWLMVFFTSTSESMPSTLESMSGNGSKCPNLTNVERAFLKTEKEIMALKNWKLPGTVVTVRKLKSGSKLTLGGVRKVLVPVTQYQKLTDSLGCSNYLHVSYGENMTVTDEKTNKSYHLVQVSADCNGPFYQPVLLGGCWKYKCCVGNSQGKCREAEFSLPYLVWNGPQTDVVMIRDILYCNCVNANTV